MDELTRMAPTSLPPASKGLKPSVPAVPATPTAGRDQWVDASARKGQVPAAGALSSLPVAVSQFFKGFREGAALEVSAKGFVGSRMVGGHGVVQRLNPQGFKLALDIEAPGSDRKAIVALSWNGKEFQGKDGTRFIPRLSADGKNLTFTDRYNDQRSMVFERPKPGEVHFSTTGFGNDGRTLVLKTRP